MKFKVDRDLLDYPIREEVAQIKSLLRVIYKKSCGIAVLDLLEDLHSSAYQSSCFIHGKIKK